MNGRSRLMLHEEICVLLAFDALMKGRFQVPWRERFMVTRTSYRSAKRMGFLSATALPVVLLSSNSFDLLYAGRILRTASLLETIAWWLEILRILCDSCLPAAIAAFKGFVIEIVDPRRQTEDGDGNNNAIARKKDDAIGDGRAESGQPQPPLPPSNAAGDRDEDSSIRERARVLVEKLNKRATMMDLTEICKVPTEGATAFKLRTDKKQRCHPIDQTDGVDGLSNMTYTF
jgi:hypothetical protein